MGSKIDINVFLPYNLRVKNKFVNSASAIFNALAIAAPLCLSALPPANDQDINAPDDAIFNLLQDMAYTDILNGKGAQLVLSERSVDQWGVAYQEFCTNQYMDGCAPNKTTEAEHFDIGLYRLLNEVNSLYNQEIAYETDEVAYSGKIEVWRDPMLSPPPGYDDPAGDCEDYAISKRAALIAGGVNPANILILVVDVQDPDNNALHAILAVKTDIGVLILDNARENIMHWNNTGYALLAAQSPTSPSKFYEASVESIVTNRVAVADIPVPMDRPLQESITAIEDRGMTIPIPRPRPIRQ